MGRNLARMHYAQFSMNASHIFQIQSSISPSTGYRFPGTGSLSYETTAYDNPCTYGGMVYAYTTQAARFWQPGNTNGAMVCIASCLGTAINNQALNDGTAVLHSWELGTLVALG
ncbi:hypothetical protein DPMN_056356 [Dreissena polymorpha]|uniref:Uncharacterized protein n=1 Tax=Dreissena polymorpha TaxID=45954 RepID=A0A9D4CTH6_DREPO|nr:hypothetical protein DPMN_056356 [Dreissena polymorpha]